MAELSCPRQSHPSHPQCELGLCWDAARGKGRWAEFAAFCFDSWGRPAPRSLACAPNWGRLHSSHPQHCVPLYCSGSLHQCPLAIHLSQLTVLLLVVQNFLDKTSWTCLFRVQLPRQKKAWKTTEGNCISMKPASRQACC